LGDETIPDEKQISGWWLWQPKKTLKAKAQNRLALP
jgi:hypothetical protein